MSEEDLEVKTDDPNTIDTFTNKPRFTFHRKVSLTLQRHLNNRRTSEFIAETFGTCLMIIIGLAGGAQTKFLSRDNSYLSDNLTPNILAGLSLTISILVVGKVSKAHLNPAVSLAMLFNKQISILEFFMYISAQFLGAFLGALIVFLIYFDAINSYGPNKYSIDTSLIFITNPNKNLTVLGIIFDQIIGTAIYLVLILALTDKKNVKFTPEGTAFAVGVALFVICSTMGYNSGSPLNPARDFSPRFFTFIAGWGCDVFKIGNFYFWIPLICPMIGSAIGTGIYWLIISRHLAQ